MKSASLIRTRSFIGGSPVGNGDPNSGAGLCALRRNRSVVLSPQAGSAAAAAALQFQPKQNKEVHLLRRARSEADITGSNQKVRAGLHSRMPLRVEDETMDLGVTGFDLSVGVWPSGSSPATVVVDEEVEYSGGGIGKGRTIGGGRGGGGDGGEGCDQNSENRRIGDYYQQMLKSDPSNPLLWRNYGRFLHEVVGDMKGAEECYGRAILASPGDGEVLSLYAKLLWEARRDGERAEAYFERAVEAAPHDCYVLGSYAQFLWDADDEDEEKEEEEGRRALSSSSLVEAF